MSTYRRHWIEVLKSERIPNWDVMEHGQAIVIKVPEVENPETFNKEFEETIARLSSGDSNKKEWLKFILYNSKFWSQFILQP